MILCSKCFQGSIVSTSRFAVSVKVQGHSLLTLQMFSMDRFLLMLVSVLHKHSSSKTVEHCAQMGGLPEMTKTGLSLW